VASGREALTRIEKKFWDIVCTNRLEVEVDYGNDIDSQAFGSGFPTGRGSHYANHPWNLQNFAKLPGSVIASLDASISGVNVPWVPTSADLGDDVFIADSLCASGLLWNALLFFLLAR
jgi:hypothetical protein